MWQLASDIVVFLGWFWENTTSILNDVFLPVRFIYAFLKQFFVSAFASPTTPEVSLEFSTNVLAVFNSVPYFDVLISTAILGITILIVGFIIKHFLST